MIATIPGNFYEPHRLYCFTVNTDDQHQYFQHADRLNKCKTYYYEKLLEALNPYADYVAYLELSEPKGDITALGPRAHIHGTFILRSKKHTRQFLLYGLYALRKSSVLNIDTIQHASVWAKYITKQQDIIRLEPFTNNTRMVITQTESDDEEGADFLQIKNKDIKSPKARKCHASQAKGLELSLKAKRTDNDLFLLP